MNVLGWSVKELLGLGMTSREARLLSGVHTLLRKPSSIEKTTPLLMSHGMSRRSAIGLLFSAGIASGMDVERLLWTPKKSILVPSVGGGSLLVPGWHNVIVTMLSFSPDGKHIVHLREVTTGKTLQYPICWAPWQLAIVSEKDAEKRR
jgi:hypothetical protein